MFKGVTSGRKKAGGENTDGGENKEKKAIVEMEGSRQVYRKKGDAERQKEGVRRSE